MSDAILQPDPIALFQQWFTEAKAHEAIKEPTAMSVATADGKGAPSNRILLLKEQAGNDFVFYTNYTGRKSVELLENPHCSLNFYWMALDKQVRIEGRVTRADAARSDAYFASRPRESQIGAWASEQSQPMKDYGELEARIAQYAAKFDGQNVPRPPHWGGWVLSAERIEFWHQLPARLHKRWEYRREGDAWIANWLFP